MQLELRDDSVLFEQSVRTRFQDTVGAEDRGLKQRLGVLGSLATPTKSSPSPHWSYEALLFPVGTSACLPDGTEGLSYLYRGP